MTTTAEKPLFWEEDWLNIPMGELDIRTLSPERYEAYQYFLVHQAEAERLEREQKERAERSKIEGKIEGKIEIIKELLKETVDEAKKLKEKLTDFKDKIREKKDLEWQNKKDLEKLTQQQQNIT